VLIFYVVTMVMTAAFATWMWFPSKKALRNRGEQFARQNLVFIDSEFVPAFDRAWTWTRRLIACFLVVLVLTMVVVDNVDHHVGSSQVESLPLLGFFIVCLAGLRLRMAGRGFPVAPGRAVVARPRRVELRDYVSGPAQAIIWINVVLCLGVAGWALIHPPQAQLGSESAAVTAIAAIVLLGVTIFVDLTGRAMCSRPQASVDPCHLYFQDAWRGGFILGTYAYVSWGAYQFLLAASIYVFDSLPDGFFIGSLLMFLGEVAVYYSSRLRFRARLWPTLLPGQVLLPGQPVPPKIGVPA
jgi:hypothetical protein